MRRAITAPMLLVVSATLHAAAGGSKSVEELKRGMPKDVASYIEQVFECEHWAGEEPYDQARRKQIGHAVLKLKCDSLPSEKKRLQKKYRTSPRVLQALDDAHDLN